MHSGENDWHPDKKRLYEFVVRSFLAACSLDAVGFETVVVARIAGGWVHRPGWASGGPGWRVIYLRHVSVTLGDLPPVHLLFRCHQRRDGNGDTRCR